MRMHAKAHHTNRGCAVSLELVGLQHLDARLQREAPEQLQSDILK